MKKAARAIILDKDKLLVMNRTKVNDDYDTLIGGSLEMGETPLQAILREIREEASIQVTTPQLVFVERAPDPYGVQYIFLCNYVSGIVALDSNTTEAKINQLGFTKYIPLWRTIEEFTKVKFRSPSLQKAILDGINNGFPTEPIDITNT